jgi:hypothetical protein
MSERQFVRIYELHKYNGSRGRVVMLGFFPLCVWAVVRGRALWGLSFFTGII